MNYVNQYSQWYCSYCQQYHQPAPAQVSQAAQPLPVYQQQQAQVHYAPPGTPQPAGAGYSQPPKQKSKTPMIIGGVVVLVLLVILASAFLFMGPDEDNGDTKTQTQKMDMQGLMDDMVETDDSIHFKSLEPGDKVIIEDEIVYIATKFQFSTFETETYIWFESTHQGESVYDWRDYDPYLGGYTYHDYDLTFDGDLSYEYGKGDNVQITLHVIEITYDGVKSEYFDEMWDGEDLQNLPNSAIDFVWEPSNNGNGEEEPPFATVEIDLEVGEDGMRYLVIDHRSGNPIKWSEYIITVKDVSSNANLAIIGDITGIQKFGETFIITDNRSLLGGIYSSDIFGVTVVSGDQYEISILDLAAQQLVHSEKIVAAEH